MKSLKTISLSAFSLIGALLLIGFAQKINFKSSYRQFTGSPLISDEIIVQFKPYIGKSDFHKIASKLGMSLKKPLSYGPYAVFRLKGKRIKAFLESIKKEPDIVAADQNSFVYKAMIPNDPYYSFQWHLNKINMPDAWDDSEAGYGNGIVVAIIDTGIAYENYDIYQRAPDLLDTRFIAGYDFVNEDTHANDDEGHGTHICGTIAQTTNNSYGAAGIAFKATIMPIKILNQYGYGTADALIDALYFAADNGCDVANMSLSWPPGYNPGETVHNAVKYAQNKGVIMVGASGNDALSLVSYPAAYPEVIAVGGTNSADERAYYSNYGSAIEICAPGGDDVDRNADGYPDGVLQQTFDGYPTNFGFWFYMGTSSAAGHVSGLIALLLAKGANGISGIRDLLHETSKDLGSSGWDSCYGYGRIDAYAALNAVGQSSAKRLTWSSGNSIQPKIAVSGSNIHVVWQEEISGKYEIFYKRSTDDGRSWITKRLTYSEGNSLFPTVAVSTSDIHVVWQQDIGGDYEIFYKKSSDNGENWSSATRLTWSENGSWYPALVASGSNLHIVWSESLTRGNKEIYYKRSLTSGTSWGDTRRLTWMDGDSDRPSVALSGANVFLVWQDNYPGKNEIYFKRSPDNGVSWTSAQRLTWTGGDSLNPCIDVYSDNVHLFWECASANTDIFYKRSLNSGISWLETQRLTWTDFYSSSPSIRVVGTNLHLVWEDNSYTNRSIFYKKSEDNGASWFKPERLTWPSGCSYNPNIDISGSRIHLVWDDDSPGNREIYFK
jgi:serine protease